MRTPTWKTIAALAIAASAAVPASAAAKPVRVSAAPVTRALTSKPAKATIAVKNVSRRRVSGLTVSIGSAKGVRVTLVGARRGRLSRALKPLRAGKTARVGVRLRRTGRGPQRGRLLVTVTRRGRTLARTRLAFGPRRPGQPGRPAPDANPNSLEGRYFWGSRYTASGTRQNTLWFTGPDLVFTAETGAAWPTCAAPSEQCKPYRYDAASGQLTIDGRPASLAGRRLELDGDRYSEFGFPRAGARFDTRVTYANSSGVCPLFCSYYSENLTFAPDGRFTRDALSSGTAPVVDWVSVPPDSKGVYEVRADRTLRLAFDDGRERIATIGLYLGDDGALQPAGDGMILGGDGYFDIRD